MGRRAGAFSAAALKAVKEPAADDVSESTSRPMAMRAKIASADEVPSSSRGLGLQRDLLSGSSSAATGASADQALTNKRSPAMASSVVPDIAEMHADSSSSAASQSGFSACPQANPDGGTAFNTVPDWAEVPASSSSSAPVLAAGASAGADCAWQPLKTEWAWQDGAASGSQSQCSAPAPARTSGEVEALRFDISSPRQREAGPTEEPEQPRHQQRSMQALHDAKQDALSLSEVLARAKPSWTEQDVAAVSNKLMRIGVFDVVKLKEALAGDINQRLRDAGYKKFLGQETLNDLKQFLHLDEYGLPLPQGEPEKEQFRDRKAERQAWKEKLGLEHFDISDGGDPHDELSAEKANKGEDDLEDKLDLRHVVMVARPDWSVDNADVVVNKLKTCGVLNLQMLAEALSEGLNERMRKAGPRVRTFATSFLGALRVAVDEALAEKEKSTCIDTDSPSQDVTSEDDDTFEENIQNQKEGSPAGSRVYFSLAGSSTSADIAHDKATASSANGDVGLDEQGKLSSAVSDAADVGKMVLSSGSAEIEEKVVDGVWSDINIKRTFIEAVEIVWNGGEEAGPDFQYGVEWLPYGGQLKTDEAAFANTVAPVTYVVRGLAPATLVQLRIVKIPAPGAVDPIRQVGQWCCAVTQPLMMWSTLSPTLQIRAATDAAGIRRRGCRDTSCSGYLHSAIFSDDSAKSDMRARLCCFRCGLSAEQHVSLDEELRERAAQETQASSGQDSEHSEEALEYAEADKEAAQPENTLCREGSQQSQKSANAEEPRGSSESLSAAAEASMSGAEAQGVDWQQTGPVSEPPPNHNCSSGCLHENDADRWAGVDDQRTPEKLGDASPAHGVPSLDVLEAREAILKSEDVIQKTLLDSGDEAQGEMREKELRSVDESPAAINELPLRLQADQECEDKANDAEHKTETAEAAAAKKGLQDAIAAADIDKIRAAMDAARSAGVEEDAIALGDHAIIELELKLLRAQKVTTCSICCEELPAGGAALLSCPHGMYCKECMAEHVQGSPECAYSPEKGASASNAEACYMQHSPVVSAAVSAGTHSLLAVTQSEPEPKPELSPTEAKIQAAMNSSKKVELFLLKPLEYEVVCSDPIFVHRKPHISSEQFGQLNKGEVVTGFPGSGWLRLTCLPSSVSDNLAKLELGDELMCESNGDPDFGWIYLGMQLAARCLKIKVSERFADALDLRWPGLPGGFRPTSNYTVEWRPVGKASNPIRRDLAAGGQSVVRQPHHCLIGLPVATTMRIRVIARISERDAGGVTVRVLGPWTEVTTDNPTASFLSGKLKPVQEQEETDLELEHLYVSSDWVSPQTAVISSEEGMVEDSREQAMTVEEETDVLEDLYDDVDWTFA